MAGSCVKRQFLSEYVDGELDSPWKEEMEAHILGCSDCAQALEAYRDNSLTTAVDEAAMNAAKERVWQKLEQHNVPVVYSKTARASTVWRRSISIPLPAAAAAVVLIAFAFVFAFRMMGTTENSGISFASETEYEVPGFIPISDMGNMDLLQYLDLDDRDNGEIIILRLPESRSFVNYSEPAIINAADYSRQVSNRQGAARQLTPGRQTQGGRK